ncbi:uncharacterized protein I303_104868 [Kwoniella dejecticola CBS 10117]|uniref:Uncharacterized protein n=1 Tax=Kwoniella dejecticola CBS 10117 TaxID=1296121 RepID=A0A1A6A445_9TREE|nr:uncharacterized protein I303_04148 [Kwoniella dejecticola CBS 10117]OBR84827.1 hypothetical protein I303_04148 [Kwoniella dejecticola CBS 10117]
MIPPSLLYHATNPTLYPTNIANDNLLVVRFNGAVRISHVRIIPEGVRSLPGTGQGTTYPPSFTARILLNVSPSNPVNALASTSIKVIPSENPLDYPIDMPVGVTTRMMMFYSPAERLTISIYGFAGDSLNTPAASFQSPSTVSSAHPLDYTSSSLPLGKADQKESYEWLYAWCGDTPNSLLDLLNDQTPPPISQRALDCLFLLDDFQPVFPLFLTQSTALIYLITHPSEIRDKILSTPENAVHPSILPLLPPEHPLKILDQPSSSERHLQAWKNLPLGLGPLLVLRDAGEEELLRVEEGEERSNVTRLADLAFAEEGGKAIDAALDILNRPFTDKRLNVYLAKHLPRLLVSQAIDGENQRDLAIPLGCSEEVIRLLVSLRGEVISGRSARNICGKLASRYLEGLEEDHPLKRVFISTSCSSSLHSTSTSARIQVQAQVQPDSNGDVRRLNRLSTAVDKSLADLDSATHTGLSSLVHSVTPSELIQMISPDLFTSLSTARVPPFGIPPSAQTDLEQGTKSFAGKVYSQHEFRKDREPSAALGLGIGNLPGGVGGVNMGMGMGGLGVGSLGGGGRAASRHVDSYTATQMT